MPDLKLSQPDRARLHAELARVFDSPPRTEAVLDDMGFADAERPVSGGRVDDYWRSVLHSLDTGLLADGYRTLLALVLRAYPANATFRQLAADYAPDLAASSGGQEGEQDDSWRDCHVAVGRDDDGEGEVVRVLADAGLRPALMWSTPAVALYRVGADDPARVSAALDSTEARWTVLAPGAPRYFLEQVVVQGPDGRAFRIRDVPAATTVADISADVLSYYLSHDAGERSAVIDRVGADGSGERLDRERTLDEAGIRDGDRLRVGYQTNAGAVTGSAADPVGRLAP